MGAEYYYLVAGLPDIVKGVPKKGLLYETLLEEIVNELTDDDRATLSRLQWRFDCDNLISILNEEDQFDSRGSFSKEVLQEGITTLTGLPAFMAEFLDARKDGKPLYPNLGEREQLLAGYFKEGISSDNPFIKEWVTFELNLGNVLAALSAKKMGLSMEKSVIALNDTAEKMVKSSASDFGIGGEFEWFEAIVNSFNDPMKLEQTLDDIRWSVADSISEQEHFSVEVILAFTVKLNSIARWIALDPERGALKVEEILKSMQSAADSAQENS